MASEPVAVKKQADQSASQPRASKDIHTSTLTSELFFAVVGPVGAGCTLIAHEVKKALEAQGFEVFPVKVSKLIRAWAEAQKLDVPPENPPGGKDLKHQKTMQDRGDDMRQALKDNAAAAVQAIAEIRRNRAFDAAAEGEKTPISLEYAKFPLMGTT